MSKWYGSIENRIEEGHNYNKDKLIHENDDITMYYWSDRHCYFVTKVIDQKHIFVKPYHVCADHSKPGGMGHQNWLYFKTIKEHNEYLNSCHIKDLDGKEYQYNVNDIVEDIDEEWIFRYNSWRSVSRWTKEIYTKVKAHSGWVAESFTEDDMKKMNEGKEIIKYHKLPGNISFGVREYYFDWEF